MRFKHVKALVEADLLQSNRQVNTNDKAPKIKKSRIYGRVAFQNAIVIILFVFLFGYVLFDLPLANYPGIFSETMGLVLIMSMLQVYQLIYSLFYDNANLTAHLSLPFSLSELFSSKIVTILFSTFAYFITPLIFIGLLGIQTGHSWILSILIAIVSTALIMVGIILSIFLGLHLLHQWPFFKKHKRIFMILLYIIFFGLIFISIYQNNPTEVSPGVGIVDSEVNPLFVGFHEIFISGLRLNGWLKVGLWLIAVLGLSYITFQWIIPQLYFEEQQPTKEKKQTKKKTATSLSSNSTRWVFAKYQVRQLSDTTLVLQMLFSKFYFPIIIIAPTLFGGDAFDLSVLEQIPHLWGAYLIIGAVIGVVLVTETSVSGVIISFDKENFHYFKSLPLSFRGYLKNKFHFAFMIEWFLGAIVLLAIMLYLGVSLFPILTLLVSYTATTYMTSLYYYMRDYRLLDLNWTNFSDLMQRGMSRALRIFIQIVAIFLGVFAMMAFLFWFTLVLSETIRLMLSIGIVILLIVLFYGLRTYSNKNFWSQFNS